eukprot:g178.t1
MESNDGKEDNASSNIRRKSSSVRGYNFFDIDMLDDSISPHLSVGESKARPVSLERGRKEEQAALRRETWELLRAFIVAVLDIVLRWLSAQGDPTYVSLVAWATIAAPLFFAQSAFRITRAKENAKTGINPQWPVRRKLKASHLLETESSLAHHESVNKARDYRQLLDEKRRRLESSILQCIYMLFVDLPYLLVTLMSVVNSPTCASLIVDGRNKSAAIQQGANDDARNVLLEVSIFFVGMSIGSKALKVLAIVQRLRLCQRASELSSALIEVVDSDVGLAVHSCEALAEDVSADAAAALATQCYKGVRAKLGRDPDLLVCGVARSPQWGSDAHDLQKSIADAFSAAAKGRSVIGAASCRGVIVEKTFVGDMKGSRTGVSVGAWGIADPEGVYITASCGAAEHLIKEECEKIVERLLRIRRGEDEATEARLASLSAEERTTLRSLMSTPGIEHHPSFILCFPSTSSEERFIDTVKQVFPQTVVFGGTPADLGGRDFSFTESSFHGEISFCVAWPSVETKSVFWDGYSRTGKRAVVTDVRNSRRIVELDGMPAEQVYNDWTGGMLSKLRQESLTDGSDEDGDDDLIILGPSTKSPFGVMATTDQNGEGIFQIAHPIVLHPDKSITTGINLVKGTVIHQMFASEVNLRTRVSRLARLLVSSRKASMDILGSLSVYCGGCGLYISDGIQEVAQRLYNEIGRKPTLGLLTFGEQGPLPVSGNVHGNLMNGLLVFTRRRLVAKILHVTTGETAIDGEELFREYEQHHHVITSLRQELLDLRSADFFGANKEKPSSVYKYSQPK